MGFLKTDLYGNKSPGTDYAPLSVKWDQLTSSQQAARAEFLQKGGFFPTQAHVLESDNPREFFTAANVDAYHDLFGGPKPEHKGPANTAYAVGKQIYANLGKTLSVAAPIAALGLKLSTELTRPGPKFRGDFIVPFVQMAVPAVGGIGGGILGLRSSALDSQPITRNPLAALLVTQGGGIVNRLLARSR